MDPDTLAQAFDMPAPPVEAPEDDELETDETDLDSEVEMLFDPTLKPEDRREAFVRAVKSAMKG